MKLVLLLALWLAPPPQQLATYEQWKAAAPEAWQEQLYRERREALLRKWAKADAIFDEDTNGPFYEIRR